MNALVASLWVIAASLFLGSGVSAQASISEERLRERAWFVGISAAARCMARRGKIRSNQVDKVIFLNLRQNRKEYLLPWGRTQNGIKAANIMETYLEKDCSISEEKYRDKFNNEIYPLLKQ